jgi:serine/tyrosine/threonine adenylyltransferase
LILEFDNRFVRSLPGDPETRNFCRQVRNACYSFVPPTPTASPSLIAFSSEVADLLGIESGWLQSEQAARVLSGNELLPGMQPYAACYGGHQFGNWAGQLGDGRAINLGEKIGRDGKHWTLQLKGAGQTPYSRSADGLAVLRSSVREFLCSEAMHHLGVPTTRALSLALTGDQVTRDMFYDGRPQREQGAIVCRVAPTFIRFGNFEILASREETDNLKRLVDFTIASDFPHISPTSEERYRDWFEEVCVRTAEMVVHWMRVGFVHGVMNTDNMSILGQTIDYGPYGWIDGYDLGWTPNTTDAAGRRYAYGQQPQICYWNLLQLANALWSLFGSEPPLRHCLDRYVAEYQLQMQSMMASKLGLKQFEPATDEGLLEQLSEVLQTTETDMTLFYRALATIKIDSLSKTELIDRINVTWIGELLRDAYYTPVQAISDVGLMELTQDWLQKYVHRLLIDGRPDAERVLAMNQVNPIYVLRNYLAQQAIEKAEQGDNSEIAALLDVLRNPYVEQTGKESYAVKRPDWARNKPGCSTLSCSS